MGYLLFSEKEPYLKAIEDYLPQCDEILLDRILTLILKHFYPDHFRTKPFYTNLG